MKEVKYCELKYGDLFKLQPDNKMVVYDIYNHRTKDRRVFRKTNDGALEIINCFGDKCEAQDYRVYCYSEMPVYIEEE